MPLILGYVVALGSAGCATQRGQLSSRDGYRDRGVSTSSPPAPDPASGASSPIRQVSAEEESAADAEAPLPGTSPESTGVLGLDEVLQVALESNPDFHLAVAQVRVADATLARARAEFYPTLGFVQDYGVTDNAVNAFSFRLNQGQLSLNQDFNNPPTIDDFHTQLEVQHRLYAGGRRQAEADAAAAGLEASKWGLAAVQNQLLFRVAEAYYRLLQAEQLVRVRQEAVEQVQRHLEIVQSRFRAETAVKSDVLSVQVRLAEVREALITARNQVELAWAVLENVTGVHLDRRPLPSEIPAAPWSDHVIELQQAVAEALARRAEVTQLEDQRTAALNGAEAARSGKRFAVDFVTDYHVHTGDFREGSDSFFTGLVLSLNLFDGGRTAGEVRKAIAQVQELEARHRKLVLDIELEVRRASVQLSDAEQRLEVATQAIEQARESLREIEVRYRGQTAAITQLVDAQVALSNAEVRRTNARTEVEVARTALERSIGRLTDWLAR